MQLLWNKEYKMNTVHVFDVARAVWHLCRHGAPGEVYNLADNGDTSELEATDHDFSASM